jgi:hypothetical protein
LALVLSGTFFLRLPKGYPVTHAKATSIAQL